MNYGALSAADPPPETPDAWETKAGDLGVGYINQLSDFVRKKTKKKVPFGFQPPKKKRAPS